MKRFLFLFLLLSVFFASSTISQAADFVPIDMKGKFKFVCKDPCPFNQDYLQKFKRRTYITYRAVKKLVGMDIPAQFFPIKIHLTEDEICKTEIPNGAHAIVEGPNKGTICKFSVMSPFQVKQLTPYGNIAHETMHFFFPFSGGLKEINKFEHPIIFSLEYFLETPKTLRSFCRNDWMLLDSNKKTVADLCYKAGFELKHVPQLLQKIQDWSRKNPNGTITMTDYAKILKEITGRNVAELLKNH